MDENGRRRIAIACQGGGAHAAFAAGVLKKILEEIRSNNEYQIVALSGTSGGAICALLAWYGLIENKEHRAIDLLETFWKEENSVTWPEEAWFANTILLSMSRWLENSIGMPTINPYDISKVFDSVPPLRSPAYWQSQLNKMLKKQTGKESIEDHVVHWGKEEVSSSEYGPVLYIGAANPITGEFRVFRSHKPEENDESGAGDEKDETFIFNRSPNDGISVDAVLASAAIPFIFKAVRTGKAVYWRRRDPHPRVADGVYWDGLYSSNPPIRELAELKPDEIWVIQINPEEINNEPKSTGDIEDRRNELAGNLSLNQELYFVRTINELVRRFGKYEGERIKLGDRSGRHKKEYTIIKVRRVELTRRLDYYSKLDRDATSIKKLMDHDSEKEAAPFLQAVSTLYAFEQAWERALMLTEQRNIDDAVDSVMDLLGDGAKIKLVPPTDSSASERCWDDEEKIRNKVRWCLRRNFSVEQTRYYRVEGDTFSWWMLATADHLHAPVKGRVELVTSQGKIQSFTFYPLDINTLEKV